MANKKLILCIDDEPEILELTQLLLNNEGYEVHGALGGNVALKAMQTRKPDLVLLDLMMDDMNGWELYRHMRADENLVDVPVIMVTARSQSVDKALGLHVAKVADYIVKPFGPRDLVDSVKKVIGPADE